jgi:hypothetical protein
MRKSVSICGFILVLLANYSCGGKHAISSDLFAAYYTKVSSDEEFEKYSRTGDHADIVVNITKAGGKLVFWRGSSHLPYWETAKGRWFLEELIKRRGDGTQSMPDRVNTYSRVFIIKNTQDEAVIHWRYLARFSGTNPHSGVEATKFVDEYFTIFPTGRVIRTVKEGTAKIDAWLDPGEQTVQTFTLQKSGIADVKITTPSPTRIPAPAAASPIITRTAREPASWWKFDEAAGDRAIESVSGQACVITGHKSLWRKGISGTALQFDGYTSLVTLPNADAPRISEAVTIEGWVAIGAYPWNWVPVVQSGDEEGYYLGIDGYGSVGFKLKIEGRWEELISTRRLDRRRWFHIAGTYTKLTGEMKIYIDGQVVEQRNVAKAGIDASSSEVLIGKGKDYRPINPVRKNTFIDSYSFDGLIDEVRIYAEAISPDDIALSFAGFRPPDRLRDNPDMDARILPAGETTGKFGARYTHLKYYDTWDNLWRFGDHPDVVVEFDDLPTKFVFWRGTGYIPMLVNEKGQWYSNEFNETWSTSGQGCQEPMSDKESYTNHARIIENSDARVVIHWRYPLVDVFHVTANYDPETGWGDWSDWYYTIYPDGMAVKRMRLWTHGKRNHEWQESMAIFGPDQHPEQIIEKQNTITMVDLMGHSVGYDWINGPPPNVHLPEDKRIQYVDYTGEYDPVTIGTFVDSNVYGGELTPYAVFPTWNHWPVAQMPSDGRYASFPDRTAHSSLTHLKLPVYRESFGDRPFEEKILMEGMVNKAPEELVPLAKSWLQPADLEVSSGCQSLGYDRAQRAYLLTAHAPSLLFRIKGSEDSPIVNPCFVIKNWQSFTDMAGLSIKGDELLPSQGFRQGIIHDTDGSAAMVIWIKFETTEPVEIVITKTNPF